MNHKNERNHQSDRLKIVAGISAVAFAIALAVIIGQRLSDESLAVLAGAVCGVGAAIPTSLLVIVVTRRQITNQQAAQPTNQALPPVVVVAPPGTQPQALPSHISPLSSIPVSPPREFTIVGDGYEE